MHGSALLLGRIVLGTAGVANFRMRRDSGTL